jgi:hypothetical protein
MPFKFLSLRFLPQDQKLYKSKSFHQFVQIYRGDIQLLVFIRFLHRKSLNVSTLKINAPNDISEMELAKLIERNDLENAAFHFRVPMSLGEPHAELDNGKAIVCQPSIQINKPGGL